MASSLFLSVCRRTLADSALSGRVRLVAGVGYPVFPRARQSVGFQVLDHLAKNSGAQWKVDHDVGGYLCQVSDGNASLVLLKPNYPGLLAYHSVEKAIKKLNLQPQDLTVVREDHHHDVGNCSVEKAEDMRGSDALKYIIWELKTDSFKHICVGIGLPADGQRLKFYVREDFRKTELDSLAKGVKKAATLVMDSC